MILIVDDHLDICRSLSQNFELRDHACVLAHDFAQARDQFERLTIDLILLDLALGGESGMDVLKHVQEVNPNIPVIMITGHGSVNAAVEAMKLGAVDFVQKPIQFESLLVRVEQALTLSHLREQNQVLVERLGDVSPSIQTRSPHVESLLSQAQRLAETNIPIMIQGESGTGKELMAEFIHVHSRRQFKPFKHINCAALAENLLDDELFGHEKGAFTGALQKREGLFESADGGTLHLDEIGDMALSTQAKVLRVLQNKELRRLGGSENIYVDIRIVASTNKDLEKMVQDGSFREDLYYRLKVASLVMPALKHRIEDLELMCPDILKRFAFEHNRRICRLSDEVLQQFREYPWPGNIRELKNVLQVAATLCEGELIEVKDLKHAFAHRAPTPAPSDNLKGQERETIARVLDECEGNKSLAAEKLSISRKTLYNKISKYGL